MSPIFHALGISERVGTGAVRLTVGRFTTEDEIDRAAELLVNAANS
jgi:cysteine sulfinate desulfinase/cysteine desulfurase-like protein